MKNKLYSRYLLFFALGLCLVIWLLYNPQSIETRRGLVAQFEFNGNSHDSVTGNKANVYGAHLIRDRFSNENAACYFDGQDDYIEVKDGLNFSQNFTFCFWLNPASSGSERILFLKGEGCPDGNRNYNGSSYSILLTPDNSISAAVTAPNGNHTDENISFVSHDKIKNENWVFVAVSYDNKRKSFSCFIDGEEGKIKHKYRSSPDDFTRIYETKASLKIGAEENYCGYKHKYGSYFSGAVDDIRIYDRVLSGNDIKSLYVKPYDAETVILFCSAILILVLGIYFVGKSMRLELNPKNVLGYLFSSNPVKLVFTAGLVFIYYLVFSQLSNYTNTAYFGGDTWEYQSMAVNFAKGHGVQKFGGLEKFEDYRFDRVDSTIIDDFNSGAGTDDFYRTPGYSFFLGSIYKIAGVNPYVAKKCQLLLLIIIASCLPWIGYSYWSRQGFLSGLLSGPIYLFSYYDTAGLLLAEPLISFSLFLIVVAFILFEKRSDFYTSLLLGVILGIGLLVKGIIVFVPFPILLLMAWRYYKSRGLKILLNMLYISLGLMLSILPWSIYASCQSNSFIVLSTQGGENIMDCNNEFAVDGLWHPEWRKDVENKDKYFYNSDGLHNSHAWVRIINFYKSHPEVILTIFKNKIASAFSTFFFFWFTMLLFIVSSYGSLFGKYFKRSMIVSYLAYLLVLPLLVLLICYSLIDPGAVSDWMHENMFLVLLASLIPLPFNFSRSGSLFKVPIVFQIIFINFLLITIIFFGATRYIGIMDFIFMLCAFQYGTQFIKKIYIAIAEPVINT